MKTFLLMVSNKDKPSCFMVSRVVMISCNLAAVSMLLRSPRTSEASVRSGLIFAWKEAMASMMLAAEGAEST